MTDTPMTAAHDIALAPRESFELLAISRPHPRVRFFVAFIIGMFASLVLGASALYAFDRHYSTRVLPGVTVGGIELAGLTPEEATARLEDAFASFGQGRAVLTAGDTSRLNVVGNADAHEALGALIGRKGERLSALQHLVNLMLSRRMGEWTRVLVDVEDYRGRRERQLRDIANRAAARVQETGKMLQLEPMPALERRWIHLALRDHPDVATQSIGEEPNRRIVIILRGG